jgi:hypothetical protein
MQPRQSTALTGLLTTTVLLAWALEASAGTQVEEAWVARYDRGFGHDTAKFIAVDRAGNVYVAGDASRPPCDMMCEDFGTLKYGPDGTRLWEAFFFGTGNIMDSVGFLAIDGESNVYVTGTVFFEGQRDSATVKYDEDGKEVWSARIDTGGNDVGGRLVLDEAQNVYLAASLGGGNEKGHDAALVKYDNDGKELWRALFDGGEGMDDFANGLVMGPDGNLYVAGISKLSAGLEYVTLKYDPAGNRLWVARFSDPILGDGPVGPAVDSGGNVYIAGVLGLNAGERDILLVKYAPDAKEIWSRTYAGAPGGDDRPARLVIGPSGHLYVAGTVLGGARAEGGTDSDMVLLKYDLEGNKVFSLSYQGFGGGYDAAAGLAVDKEGNAYVTGTSVQDGTEQDVTTLKYDASGNLIWSAFYDGLSNMSDRGNAIVLDSSGNVYVTGESYGTPTADGTQMDYVTIKYVQSALPAVPFVRGDADASGKVDISDAIYTLLYLFRGGAAPSCLEALDAIDDGKVNISDAIFLLVYLFVGGLTPTDPFAACGADPTEDALGCGSFPQC